MFSVISYAFQVKNLPSRRRVSFETSTLLVAFTLLGQLINEFIRLRFAKWVSIQSQQPNRALLVMANLVTRKIDSRLLEYGDHFSVPPNTRIVTEGLVTHGGSEVD